MPDTPDDPLQRPVRELRGIGPERAVQLARLKVLTVGDLLRLKPRRYEDRRHCHPIAGLRRGEAALVQGRIVVQGLKRFGGGRKTVFEFVLDDGSARLHCRWWNLPFMEQYFKVGDTVFVFGKPNSLKPRTMDHPETEVVEPGEEASLHLQRIVPVYPLTDGLPQRWLRSLMWRMVNEHAPLVGQAASLPGLGIINESGASQPGQIDVPPGAGEASGIREPKRVDGAIHSGSRLEGDGAIETGAGRLPAPREAIRWLHFPEEEGDAEAARQRLALDELIELQSGFLLRRRKLNARARGLPCAGDNRLQKPFLKQLGFQLTEAQTRVLRELRADLGGAAPMRRLLQGDVGSGKTVVAACTALMAIESGFEAALMAPTEILAEQHFETFGAWFGPLGVAVNLQTGGRKIAGSGDGAGRLTIGTHALVEEGFQPEQLGLVIIDEQHKFGVTQRERLVRKGRYPHLLVMTATPIPRTLGLTLYGDLDLSVIDQLPAGRGVIQTHVREADKLAKVWDFIQARLAEGRQAYVVYPRLEDSDLTKGLKAVVDEYERLAKQFPKITFGLIHGRLNSAEKNRVMRGFAAGELQVLVATSVVEVGLNVPNATVMLIENADWFGLAQLHQLRGRIGRGAHESHCILISDKKKADTWERLRVLTETNDGFRIAEEDLRLRGPGDMLGREQSGVTQFRFADLRRDLALVERARELVRAGG